MRVTEQIDALESLGRSPGSHLIVPRVIAGLIMIPVLTILADVMGIGAGWFSMLPRLERTARLWAAADSSRAVMPALHLIATVAQEKPGGGGKYRLRLGTAVIDSVARWVEDRGWILILDIQIGHSTVAAELEPLLPYLRRPYVHLALDPEFAMVRPVSALDRNQARQGCP